jgi:hypothetical protein
MSDFGGERQVVGIRRRIADSAAQWGLSPRAVPWVFWTPLVGAAVIAALRLNKDVYRFLLIEDGPVEWAQFLCFAIACIFSVGIASRRFKAGYRGQGLAFLALAAVTFLLAGEEIAWGQRILGLETPEALRKINEQEEITLHNVGDVLDVLNVVMLAIGLVGFLACLYGERLRLGRFWDRADHLFVPPVFLAPSFLVLFLYKLFRATIWTKSGFTITKYGEWAELCLAFALGLFVWLNYRRLATAHSTVGESVADAPTEAGRATCSFRRIVLQRSRPIEAPPATSQYSPPR